MDSSRRPITNFGGNQSFQPGAYCVPQNEADVLELLALYRGRNIRAIGRLHSWSAAAVTDDILLDLRNLNDVRVERQGDTVTAVIGAGCQIKRLLSELQKQGNFTLPSLGLITEQSIVGAASTGTHGSGKNSLSHYVTEVRVAAYDPQTGWPVVRTISDGPELRAARCSLGCLGIIVSVRIQIRLQYMVEEHARRYATLNEVLAAEHSYPLQQFFLLPWSWHFISQHRREVEEPRSKLATLYRIYWFLTLDLSLHLVLLLLAKVLRSAAAIKAFYRKVFDLGVIFNWVVVDRSDRMLIMEHELFRHIEIELFVPRSRLPAAMEFVPQILRCFDGDRSSLSAVTRERLTELNLLDPLLAAAGTYTHHYPICVRRVLPDDTLISPAAGGDEDWYAVSFISYVRPSDRAGFFTVAGFLARSMVALFGARPHWGKVNPLDAASIESLYPRLPEFRTVARTADPSGVFRNRWIREAIFAKMPGEQGSAQSR